MAVQKGAVAKGSYLLVENLDRISRQTARKALRTLESIVETGVTVVTLSDGKAYTVGSLDSDPVSLLMAILTFVRAHEESELKGRRVRAAWDNKRQRAVTDGTPLTKRLPGWLTTGANGRLRIDQKRAAIVRRIFKMTLDGVGQHSIAATLNRENVKAFNAERWHRSYVKKILENPAVMGRLIAYRVEWENGRKVRNPAVTVDKHFPAVVSVADWTRVQEMRDVGASGGRSRAAPRTAAPLQNILAGLARCPLCSGTMTRVSKGPTGGSPYLVCAAAKAGARCKYRSVRMEDVEACVMREIGSLLADAPLGDPDIDSQLRAIEDELTLARERAENVTAAIAERGMTGALGSRLRLLEKAIGQLETKQAATLSKIEGAPLLVMQVEALRKETTAAKLDRRKVNALFRQLLRAVVIDYATADLEFQWKHGGVSRVSYGMPPAKPRAARGRARG